MIIFLLTVLSAVFVHIYGLKEISLRYLWAKYFIVFWAILIVVSGFNPYDLYPVHDLTYTILYLFVISFFIGINFNWTGAEKLSARNFDYVLVKARFFIDSKINFYLSVILCVVLGFYFIRYYSYIMAAGLEETRTARFEVGGVFSSVYEALFFMYFVGCGVWLSKFSVAFSLAYGGNSKLSVVLNLTVCLLYLGFGGGRNIITEIFLMYIFLGITKKFSGEKYKSISKKIILIISGTFVAVIAVITTFFRMFPNEGINYDGVLEASSILVEHAIVYFVGSFRAFEYALKNYEAIIGFNYGQLGLAGLDELFSLMMTVIGYKLVPFSNEWGAVLSIPISVGQGIGFFNALYTAVFNFYFDFGIVGPVIWGLMFGIFCSFVVGRVTSYHSVWYIFVAAMLFVTAMLTPLSWKLTAGSPVLVIILACYFGEREIRFHQKNHSGAL